MRKIRGIVVVLVAVVWCPSAPLAAQPSGSAGRSIIPKPQDIEYRLSDATVAGEHVVFAARPAPSISFHSGGIISGYAGLNDYFAAIKLGPDGGFTLDSAGLATTKLVGEPQLMHAEMLFLNALQATRFIRLQNDAVVLETADQTTKLTFTRSTPVQELAGLLNVELLLTRFLKNGAAVNLPAAAPITLTFQDNGHLSGRSAVNSYSGVFTAMPNGDISLQSIVSTQMAGPPELMALETAYFDALSVIRHIRVNGAKVILEDDAATLEFVVRSSP